MPDDIPTISYWCGVPVSEMPRDELEREFINAYREIEALRRDICDRSIAHIRDLATFKRAELHEKHKLLRWMGVS